MNFFELIPLTASAVNLSLALFVFARNLRATLNRVFLLWGVSIAVWNLGTFCMFRVSTEAQAFWWAKVIQAGVICLPFALFHLSLMVARVELGRTVRFLYLLMLVFMLANWAGLVAAGAEYVPELGAYYTRGGPLFPVFLAVYSGVTILTLGLLYRLQQQAARLHRMRLRSLLIATVILFVFGSNDLLPILGIHHYPLTATTVRPYGSVAAIFYGIMVAYGVLQHQLLDIRVVLGKLAANVVRLAFVFLVGLFLLLVGRMLLPELVTPPTFGVTLVVLLLSAGFASFYFPRLFGKGDDAIERVVIGDRFEYHDKIKAFAKSIPNYTELGTLLADLQDLLVHTVQVKSYLLIGRDETTKVFAAVRSHPLAPPRQFTELTTDSPAFRFFETTKADYLAMNVVYTVPGETPLVRAARQQLQPLGVEFCFPCVASDDLFGFLLLGGKTNGELFTPHDVRLLSDLVKNLGLVLNQMRLKREIQLKEELELLGRMSRGMAHDLNNLLTPISTFMQLFECGLLDKGKAEELLPTALRNLRTIQAYIKEALFFSQHRTPQFGLSRLDLLVQRAVELAQPRLERKGIRVAVKTLPDVTAEVDDVLIQRLLGNLISNAVDASPPDSQIVVELQRLLNTDTRRDWLRLKVVDEGEGIRAENLKRIFSAYFTTKDRGDETRGFGLGLSICRQIVQLHGGTLNIASEEKRGTTVQVDLPSRQISRAQPVVELST